jgi:predicted DNA-binding protein with PD1-like motif
VGGHLVEGRVFLLELKVDFVDGKIAREREEGFPLPVWTRIIKGE